MSEPRIRLRNVTVRFRMSYDRPRSVLRLAHELGRRVTGRWQPQLFTALDGISFEARSGEVIGMIGRNGAGKSTLLRAIAGIYHPDFGEIAVNGRVSALLALGTGFNTALTGRENIFLGALTLGYSVREVEDRMDTILEFAEIGEFIDVPMRYYSSGMMSRVSFAVVISMEPDILLIDETLSVGDLGFQSKARQAMRRMLKRASCQIIVSHSTSTIRKLCTRAILIERGRILADGPPDEVVGHYEAMLGCGRVDHGISPAELVAMQG